MWLWPQKHQTIIVKRFLSYLSFCGNTGVFLWILQTSERKPILKKSLDGCFCVYSVLTHSVCEISTLHKLCTLFYIPSITFLLNVKVIWSFQDLEFFLWEGMQISCWFTKTFTESINLTFRGSEPGSFLLNKVHILQKSQGNTCASILIKTLQNFLEDQRASSVYKYKPNYHQQS